MVRLNDLLKQATVERSHYYVGSVVRDCIAHIAAANAEIARLKNLIKLNEHGEKVCRVTQACMDKLLWHSCACCEEIHKDELAARDNLIDQLAGALDRADTHARKNGMQDWPVFKGISKTLAAHAKWKEANHG